MKRLVYTLCPDWQSVQNFIVLFLHNRSSSVRLPNYTYNLLLFAALLLLPNLVEGQCFELICNQNVEVKLDGNCEGEANPYFLLANYWSCTGPANMEYFDAFGQPIAVLNSNHIGQTIDVHMTHNWSGHTCWGTIQVLDRKKPNIDIDHVTLNCTEDTSVPAVGEPTVSDNCSNNITVIHQDTVLDFGCGYTGFAGYFDPSNWAECLTNNGDGGVDVTGAPESILVEGASNSPHSSSPKYVTKYKIVIPTEGYISFDWSSFGGSSFDSEGFYLTINNWCIQITNDSIQSGSYTTGLLHPGDLLSFEQVSEGDPDAVHTLVENFHFHTLAWKVINRTWSATDEYGNTRLYTQVITQNRAQLSQVVFPLDRDGVAAPMLTCGAMADISQTGQPFIDEDGDLNTTDDQFDLDNGECAFNVGFTDQAIATCEGSELVLRTWAIVDDCTSQVMEHTQIIKIFDTTPPVISCPQNQTASTDNFGCFGNINLPNATATDDCSSTIDIVPNWNFGNGYGPFGNIPVGTYTITYEATDDCGNTSSCQTSITVEDAIGPTVVCDGQTVASLDSDGSAMVYANVVDDGSYDWCCVESFEIKRQGTPDSEYAPTLPVDCTDLGPNLMVTLKVTDCAGNFNSCNVEVIVNDNHDPVILAPDDVTVDCNTDLTDLSIFGTPTVFDNCDFTLSATYDENFTSCGQGAIVRSWTATDPSGNSVSATQSINLANLAPWNINGSQISWPFDYVTSGCGLSLEPFDLPNPYSGPILVGQTGCESVAVSHTDDYFWIAEPSCYKVFRNWKIIDWCQYDPNNGNNDGLWEHVQVIEVNDNEAPVFINPINEISIQVESNNGNCSGEVLVPMPQIDDCSNHVTITASGDLGVGFNFQNVQVGTYHMNYFAFDGCGNQTNHSFTVFVGDNFPPTAYCLNGLIVNLDSNGEVWVDAATLDDGSSDNCSSNLTFSFSPDPSITQQLFTCDDEGQNLVELFVFDEGMNFTSCQTYIMVMANPTACMGPDVNIEGLLFDHENGMIEAASIELEGGSSPASTNSQNGTFSFNDLPSGNNYNIKPAKTGNIYNGVSAYDLAKINDHIIGVDLFTETWQYIGADANGNGSVSVSDIVAIQNLILHNITEFPNGTPSWQFVPADHVFVDPLDPWPFPNDITMIGLSDDYLTADFMGIKVGDVTGNANPIALISNENGSNSLEQLEDRNGNLFLIKTNDQVLIADEMVNLTFESEEALAYQFTIEFDPLVLEFSNMMGGTAMLGTQHQEDGFLTAVFYKNIQSEFSLSFRTKRIARLSQVLTISSQFTPAIAYNRDEKPMDIGLVFEDPQILAFEFFQNKPNPFSNQTAVRFQLPEAGNVSFQFFNAAGHLLFQKNEEYEMGYQEMLVSKEDLKTSGLIFYKMETRQGLKMGKMMVSP